MDMTNMSDFNIKFQTFWSSKLHCCYYLTILYNSDLNFNELLNLF